jgi:hypothetical protein
MVATEDFHMSIINAALEVVAAAALPVRPPKPLLGSWRLQGHC